MEQGGILKYTRRILVRTMEDHRVKVTIVVVPDLVQSGGTNVKTELDLEIVRAHILANVEETTVARSRRRAEVHGMGRNIEVIWPRRGGFPFSGGDPRAIVFKTRVVAWNRQPYTERYPPLGEQAGKAI
jgi:hypothetical protein